MPQSPAKEVSFSKHKAAPRAGKYKRQNGKKRGNLEGFSLPGQPDKKSYACLVVRGKPAVRTDNRVGGDRKTLSVVPSLSHGEEIRTN